MQRLTEIVKIPRAEIWEAKVDAAPEEQHSVLQRLLSGDKLRPVNEDQSSNREATDRQTVRNWDPTNEKVSETKTWKYHRRSARLEGH